ncbi:hypothetical protein FBQ80_17430 [Candidatus Brocadia sp. AMX2]|nr:hypothetical protein [Candidatus Brocadia sp. AMX2]
MLYKIVDVFYFTRCAAFDLEMPGESFDLCLCLGDLLFVLFCVLFIDGLFDLGGDKHLFYGCRVFVLDA